MEIRNRGQQTCFFLGITRESTIVAFIFRLFKPGLVSFIRFFCVCIFPPPALFWDLPPILLTADLSTAYSVLVLPADFWTCVLHKKDDLLGSQLVWELDFACFLWDVGDMMYVNACCVLVGGDRPAEYSFTSFKSTAHLLNLKLAAITSFTPLKKGYSVQVVTLWLLTAAYFL